MAYAYCKVSNSSGEFDMAVRFENKEDRQRVMSDGLHGSYEKCSEEFAYGLLYEHGGRWVGPYTYYGGTPLDGISFYHTIYE